MTPPIRALHSAIQRFRVNRRHLVPVGLVVVISAVFGLRLIYVGHPAVWIDEAFSLYHVKREFAALWGESWKLESSPPLYYSALWMWTRAFGGDEWVARLLSVVFAAVATLFVYRGAAVLGDRKSGALAGLLFASHPLVFEYSLEIRPYGMNLLLVAISIWALARALVALESGQIRSMMAAACLIAPIVFACVLVAYTHSTAPAFLAALSGTAAFYGLHSRSERAYWATWACANLFIFVVILPQVFVILDVFNTNRVAFAFIPSPTDPLWLYVVVRALVVGQYSYGTPTAKLMGVIVLGALAWSAWRVRKIPAQFAIGLTLPVLGFALLFFVSLAQPILVPRTALWITVPLAILLGCALGDLSWRRSQVLLLTLTVLLMIHMSVANILGRKFWRPWPDIVLQQAREMRPEDEFVAVDPEVLCVMDFYAPKPLRNATRWVLERGAAQRFRSRQRIELACNASPKITVAALEQRVERGANIWLMAWNDLQEEDVEAVIAALPKTVRVTRRIRWNDITVAVRLSAP